MKYWLLSPEEQEEFKRTATREQVIDNILELLTELGRVTDRAPENS